jgi:hypothetical protein
MSNSYSECENKTYRYWRNKPVMKFNSKNIKSKQIDNNYNKKVDKNNFTDLPIGYSWSKVNIGDNEGMINITNFLTKYYDRGTNSSYIIKYDPSRLRWEMNNNGFFLCINDTKQNIVGVIGFTYRTLHLNEKNIPICEPMYMCCDKKYRNKGISRVLMDETIRQSMLFGVDKGLFCTNRIVPTPVATIRQYSRPLNYKKLRENDFIEISGVDDELAHNRTKIKLRPKKNYIVADKTDENVKIVYNLYREYMKTFNLHMVMDINDIVNYFFDERYVKTILIKDEETNKVVDFVSYNFYDIHNTNREEDNIIKTANILMYTSLKTRADIVLLNAMKQVSYDKIHLLYINDMMHSNEAILSNVKKADEDTDDEEKHACYDMHIVKTSKKTFINLFNWDCQKLRQDMVSWLLL